MKDRSAETPARLASAKPTVGAKPLIDFGRGAGGFPITGSAVPTKSEELLTSLCTGYRSRVVLPDPTVEPVAAVVDRYPHLKSLTIDLSGAKIKSDYRPSTFRGSLKSGADAIQVDHLSYIAQPLAYADAKTDLKIDARDVALALMRDRAGVSALVMTDAKDGTVNFDVPLSDLRTMVLASAKEGAGKAGFNVTSTQLKISNDGSRALVCEGHVGGWWLLVPAAFKLSARIDVDDDFNAHFSNVHCTGDDVGGALLAGFVNGAMKKYEGRVVPLARFPGNRIKIRDLKISVDDSLRVFVAFGS